MIIRALLAAYRSALFQTVDLKPIIFQPGDLPIVLVAALNNPLKKDDYSNFDAAYNQIIATRSGKTAGEVRVYLFHTPEDRDAMYNLLSLAETPEGIIPLQTPPIGGSVIARQETTKSGDLQIVLTFQRCFAVVHMWLRSIDDFMLEGIDIIKYAQKIDERLKGIACPWPKTSLNLMHVTIITPWSSLFLKVTDHNPRCDTDFQSCGRLELKICFPVSKEYRNPRSHRNLSFRASSTMTIAGQME